VERLDNFPGQADFQMKMHNAYKCNKGSESWFCLCDNWNVGSRFHSLPPIQAGLGCISAGGNSCMGIGVDFPLAIKQMKEIEDELSKVIKYKEGKIKKFVAIFLSQSSIDFDGRDKKYGCILGFLAWN